jgi:hypothetical protein
MPAGITQEEDLKNSIRDRLLKDIERGQMRGLVVMCTSPGHGEFYKQKVKQALQNNGVLWQLECHEYYNAFINRAGAVIPWKSGASANKEHIIQRTTSYGTRVTI